MKSWKGMGRDEGSGDQRKPEGEKEQYLEADGAVSGRNAGECEGAYRSPVNKGADGREEEEK